MLYHCLIKFFINATLKSLEEWLLFQLQGEEIQIMA